MSGTTCLILHLALKIISCVLFMPALLFYLLFEEEVQTLDPPQQVQGCSNALQVGLGGRTPPSSPVTTNPFCQPSFHPYRFRAVVFSRWLQSTRPQTIFTRTQDFPLLNSCLYWLACPHVASTLVASKQPHLLPPIESSHQCPKSFL